MLLVEELKPRSPLQHYCCCFFFPCCFSVFFGCEKRKSKREKKNSQEMAEGGNTKAVPPKYYARIKWRDFVRSMTKLETAEFFTAEQDADVFFHGCTSICFGEEVIDKVSGIDVVVENLQSQFLKKSRFFDKTSVCKTFFSLFFFFLIFTSIFSPQLHCCAEFSAMRTNELPSKSGNWRLTPFCSFSRVIQS